MATDPLKAISVNLKENTKAVESLEDRIQSISKRNVVDVDALTDAEIEELRLLIENEPNVVEFSMERIEQHGAKFEGMYAELRRLGFVLGVDRAVCYIDPMAHWAVEKHDQRAREREEAEKDRRRFEKRTSYISAAIGVGGAVLGFALGLIAKFI